MSIRRAVSNSASFHRHWRRCSCITLDTSSGPSSITTRRFSSMTEKAAAPVLEAPSRTTETSTPSTSLTVDELTALPHTRWLTAPHPHVREAKAALRRHIKHRLSTLHPDDITAQSQLVTQRFLSAPLTSPLLSSSPAFAVYLSMQHEFHTHPLLHSLFAHNRRIFVPVVRSSSHMDLLEAHSMADIASFPRNAWGIAQPPDEYEGKRRRELLECVEEVGVCVVPAVAWGKRGSRLGHGRGYYDRYLTRWEEERRKKGMAGSAVYVGLGLECQMVEEVPCGEQDVLMHTVIGPHTQHTATMQQQQAPVR